MEKFVLAFDKDIHIFPVFHTIFDRNSREDKKYTREGFGRVSDIIF